MGSNEKAIEAEIQSKGLNAPRLTPDMIDGQIVNEMYWTPEGTTLTVCVLTLRNGFTVTGESAAASPENFDIDIGKKIARENARAQIWQLEGYLLRNTLYETAPLNPLNPKGAPKMGSNEINVPTAMFYGTKQIHAMPMTRQEYNDYRGWQLPDDENGDDAGYLVEYVDGGGKNHPNHSGYISWSPDHVFEDAYQPNGALSFGHALEAMKCGHRVARAGWNGKGMWLRIIEPYDPKDQFSVTELETTDGTLTRHPWMKTADNKLVPWLCSLTDMMADDWQIIEEDS